MIKLITIIVLVFIFLYIYFYKFRCANDEKILVLYHVDWCKWCQKFKPIWNKLKSELNVKMVDINCEKNKFVCDRDDVNGFPTIRLVTNQGAKVIDYDGPREKEPIKDFVKNN